MGESGPGGGSEWIRNAVSLYERKLISYATHLVGDAERGRDIAQETFVRLCGQDRLQMEPRLAEWLFAVCRNLCIDVRRKEKRMRLLSEGQADSQVAPGAMPGLEMEKQETIAQVLSTLRSLTANQQEVIRLKFQHGLSYKQIAQVTTLSVSNVGFLIHTGLKTVKRRLERDQRQSVLKRTSGKPD